METYSLSWNYREKKQISVCVYVWSYFPLLLCVITPQHSHERQSVKVSPDSQSSGSTQEATPVSPSPLAAGPSCATMSVEHEPFQPDPPKSQQSQRCGKVSKFQVRKSPCLGNYNPERKFRAEWSIAANSGSCCRISRHKGVCVRVCAHPRSSTTFSIIGRSLSFPHCIHTCNI